MIYVQITISVLLLVSEALPFITTNDYQGLLHMMVTKLDRFTKKPMTADLPEEFEDIPPHSPVLELQAIPPKFPA